MFYIYFLQSQKNNKVYVGFTEKEPNQRLKEHNQGSNKFTRENKPFKLVYYEKYYCKKDALQKEKFYKSGFGKKVKTAIIQSL